MAKRKEVAEMGNVIAHGKKWRAELRSGGITHRGASGSKAAAKRDLAKLRATSLRRSLRRVAKGLLTGSARPVVKNAGGSKRRRAEAFQQRDKPAKKIAANSTSSPIASLTFVANRATKRPHGSVALGRNPKIAKKDAGGLAASSAEPALRELDIEMPLALQQKIESVPHEDWTKKSSASYRHCDMIHFGLGPACWPSQIPKGSSRLSDLQADILRFITKVQPDLKFTSMIINRYKAQKGKSSMGDHVDKNLPDFPWQLVCVWAGRNKDGSKGKFSGGSLQCRDYCGSKCGEGVFLLNGNVLHGVSPVSKGTRYSLITYCKNLSATTPIARIDDLRRWRFPMPNIAVPASLLRSTTPEEVHGAARNASDSVGILKSIDPPWSQLVPDGSKGFESVVRKGSFYQAKPGAPFFIVEKGGGGKVTGIAIMASVELESSRKDMLAKLVPLADRGKLYAYLTKATFYYVLFEKVYDARPLDLHYKQALAHCGLELKTSGTWLQGAPLLYASCADWRVKFEHFVHQLNFVAYKLKPLDEHSVK